MYLIKANQHMLNFKCQMFAIGKHHTILHLCISKDLCVNQMQVTKRSDTRHSIYSALVSNIDSCNTRFLVGFFQLINIALTIFLNTFLVNTFSKNIILMVLHTRKENFLFCKVFCEFSIIWIFTLSRHLFKQCFSSDKLKF